MSDIIKEFIKLYNWWSGVAFTLQLLAFVVYLNANYVPTSDNAINYSVQVIGVLLVNAFASAIEGAVISAVVDFIQGLFR